MESARECGDYDEWFDSKKDTIGTIGKIEFVKDYYDVLGYTIEGYDYPHYCVMPVEEEEVQEIPALENTLEQLDNLVSKAQDIISKYKK